MILGFPRNDIFIKQESDNLRLFNDKFSKIIVWYPTFRQHKNGIKTAANTSLPLMDNLENALELNNFAKERNVLLVIKPHFAQDISYLQTRNLSNILFIDDDFYAQHKLLSYEFIANCDALITDYSSVYFDYLLCNKPIGAITLDIEEYRTNPGFALDIDYYLKGSVKIDSLDTFKHFIDSVAADEDVLKSEREEICQWANIAQDGKNTKRVVDFIIEKSNL